MTVEELEVQVAQAKLDAATAKADLAKKQWDRAEKLKPHDAISGSEYDQAECDLKVTAAAVAEAEAQLGIAKLMVGKPTTAASQRGSQKRK